MGSGRDQDEVRGQEQGQVQSQEYGQFVACLLVVDSIRKRRIFIVMNILFSSVLFCLDLLFPLFWWYNLQCHGDNSVIQIP